MGKARIATGVLLVTLVTGAMGYTIASAVLTYQDLGFGAEIDFAYIAQNYLAIRDRRPEDPSITRLDRMDPYQQHQRPEGRRVVIVQPLGQIA